MTSQALSQVIKQARDQAKVILNALEQAGHPQTEQSSGLYLSLVTIQKRLSERGPTASVKEFAAELEQLAGLCRDNLAPVKPLLDEAVRLARGRRAEPSP